MVPTQVFGGSRVTLLMSVVVMVVVIILGAFVGFRIARGDDPVIETPTISPGDPSPTLGTDDPSVCGFDEVTLDGTVAAHWAIPRDEWVYQGRVGVFAGEGVGPGVTDPVTGLASCFSRTPTGTVFAAMWAYALMADASLDQVEVWAHLLARGTYRDELLAELEEIEASRTSPREDRNADIGGYRILFYDGTHAWVDLAIVLTSDGGSTVYRSFALRLTWQSGDWFLDSNTEPTSMWTISRLSSLQGYWTITMA